MTKRIFKKIRFDETVERHLVFAKTPEKKLLQIIKNLKDVFPKQKFWKNLEESRNEKVTELMTKFRKRGKFYREICKSWLTVNSNLGEEFSDFFRNTEKEVDTDDVVKFFHELKSKHKLGAVDIVIFIHIYVEQVLGVQLFEESAKILEEDLEKEGFTLQAN
ncbi:MAG: hypothetical protein JXA66_06880 [Oligoflexia bacterium]|nr:hypothetical protein [Oligoflexia bacterium]